VLLVETMQDLSVNSSALQERYDRGPYPSIDYDLPDVIPLHIHVQVLVHVTRTRDNTVFQWHSWFPGFLCGVQGDSYSVNYTNPFDGAKGHVYVKIADARNRLRDEPFMLREQRVATERAEFAAHRRALHATNLALQATFHSFVQVGARVLLKVPATKPKRKPGEVGGSHYDTVVFGEWRYVSGTVTDISGGFVWLKLDFKSFGDDEDVVRFSEVEELLSPYYSE